MATRKPLVLVSGQPAEIPAGDILAPAHVNHGMVNRTDSTFVWTDTTPDRTLTITGTFKYWYNGTEITVTGAPAAQITNTTGLWFFYFNSAGVLTASQSYPDWYTSVIVALGWWNGTHGLICDERHGYRRNIPFHDLLHNTVGCRYGAGIDLTFVAAAGSSTFATSSGNLWDEDIDFTVPISSSWTAPHAARLWKQLASTGKDAFTFVTTPSTTPFLWNSGTSRVRFVQSDHATPYTLMDCATSRYVNVWVYGVNDINQPIWMVVETKAGATGYTSTAAARAITFPNLRGLGLSPEMKQLYRLVVRGDGEIQAAVTADDYRNSSSLPSAGSPSTTAAAVTSTPSTALPGTNVQARLDAVLADADAAVASLRTLGTGSAQAMPGNTTIPAAPTAGSINALLHAATAHEFTGVDVIVAREDGNTAFDPYDGLSLNTGIWSITEGATATVSGNILTLTATEVKSNTKKVIGAGGADFDISVRIDKSPNIWAWFRLYSTADVLVAGVYNRYDSAVQIFTNTTGNVVAGSTNSNTWYRCQRTSGVITQSYKFSAGAVWTVYGTTVAYTGELYIEQYSYNGNTALFYPIINSVPATREIPCTAAGRATIAAASYDAITALLSVATTSLKGLLSAADKTKLDGIAANANVGIPPPATPEQGDVLYHDGSAWARLAHGTSGQFLKTQGHGANPAWDSPASGSSRWTAVANYTTTPASTSTITMGTDQTATLLPGLPLRYTWNGTTYYGVIAACTASLLTIRGAPLSTSYATTLDVGTTEMVKQLHVSIPGFFEDATNTGLLASDCYQVLKWVGSRAYCVGYNAKSQTADSGATQPSVNVRWATNPISTSNSNAGIRPTASWVSTGIDISTTNYVVDNDEALEIECTKNSTGDAADLNVDILMVFP